MEKLWNLALILAYGAMVVMFLFLMYVIFVVAPVQMLAEVACLELGYPVTMTTITLDSYCMTVEGAVTPYLIKLP